MIQIIFIFFASEFMISGYSVSTLVLYPYFEYKGILIIYSLFTLFTSISFLHDLIKFLRVVNLKQFIKDVMCISLKINMYVCFIFQLFFFALVVGDSKITESDTLKLCNVFYFNFNLIYLIIHFVLKSKISEIDRVVPERSFDEIVKGKKIQNYNEECPICLTDEKESYIQLNCLHIFHTRCLKESFVNNHNKCPLCRESFV